MRLTPEQRTAAIEKVYEHVPDVHCKGLCTDTCTVIMMSVHEARRLRQNGTPLQHAEVMLGKVLAGDHVRCAALVDGRCTVYELRPLICRLYGATEDMECEHGCRPDGPLIPAEEAHRMIDLVRELGGGDR